MPPLKISHISITPCHSGQKLQQTNCFLFLTLSLPYFRRHVSSTFVLNKLSIGKKFTCKVEKKKKKKNKNKKNSMTNSVDQDETAHNEPSHLDLCCLQRPIIIAGGSDRVKLLICSGKLGLQFVAQGKERICLKCQTLFSGENKGQIINLLSAEFA